MGERGGESAVGDTVAALLLARADDDGVGLRFEHHSWTWREVARECAARAAMLRAWRQHADAGVPVGGRLFHVGVMLENVPEHLFLLGGAALAGATVVGINPTRRGEELAADVRHTDCRWVVTEAAQRELLAGLDVGLPDDRIRCIEDRAYRREAAMAPGRPWIADDDAPADAPSADTLYLLLFTSGSTGAPKAVRFTHGRLVDTARAMAAGSGFGPDDVMYCSMPMFHGNALTTCVAPCMVAGATLVLRRRFSASGFLPDVRRYGVTYFNYVGRALAYVLATPQAPDDGENTLRFGFGTDASPHDIAAFRARFGCPIVEGYGSSEGAIAMSRVPGTPRAALGKPSPADDVVILDHDTMAECVRARFDDAGRLLNSSEAIGEIVSRNGAGRFEGYYRNDDAERERTRHGWFWSGDLGYRDEEGFFYFAGRPADWLRVDGENFSAAPVERILARLPGVITAAVFPVPDARTGDQVMAALEMAPGAAFDPDAFTVFLAAQRDLGTKWAPSFVRILQRMPVTGTGKVDKRPLRATRWDTTDPVWWRPAGRRADGGGRYRLLEPSDVEALERQFEAHGRQGLLVV